MYNALTLQFR